MDLQPWAPYLSIIEIILSVVLTVLVVIQAKGGSLDGLLGGGGGDSGGFRTRRGVEETIFRMTIVVGILFFTNTLLAFLAWG